MRSVGSRLLCDHGEARMCAGLGAIVEPYSIIFSKRHCTSASELMASEKRDVFACLDDCLDSGLFTSRELCVFEHGGTGARNAAACIEHFHFHVVDANYDLRALLLSHYPQASIVRVTCDEGFVTENGYLFVGTYKGGQEMEGLLVRTPSCGSQFFRKLLSQKAGTVQWNWRLFPSPEKAKRLFTHWQQSTRTGHRRELKLCGKQTAAQV